MKKSILLYLLSLTALSSSASAVTSTQRWDFTSSTEGWTAPNMTGLVASGGVLTATCGTKEPYYLSPTELSVALTGTTVVKLRFKNTTSISKAAVYFATTANPSFTGNFVEFPCISDDDEFHDYVVVMKGHPAWNGTLTKLRLDLTQGIATGAATSVDYCEIGFDTRPIATGKPNVIMILADDLGWKDCSINGSSFYRTPNLERLAARGMRFTNAYSASPLCSPTRASILTGQYPGRLRLTQPVGHLENVIVYPDVTGTLPNPVVPATNKPEYKLCEPESCTRLKNEHVTYADTMKAAGYSTAFMGKWHLGRAPYLPQNQGFDTVIAGNYYASPPSGYFSPFPADANIPASPAGTHIDDLLTDYALSFISDNADAGRPFLVNLWLHDVHAPFEGKADIESTFVGTSSSDGRQHNPTMGAMVATLDAQIGRVLDRIDSLGIADNTIIVFYSDNGGNMYDWSKKYNTLLTSNYPLRQGKASINDGGSRVPCVISWPGHTPGGSVNPAIISSVDLCPTILNMAGLAPDPTHVIDGVSLIPALNGTGTPRSAAFCFYPHFGEGTATRPGCWVRQGDWKLIRFFFDNPDKTDRYELYNIANEPTEMTNLASIHPEIIAQLDPLITQHLSDINALMPIPNPNYNPPYTGWTFNDQARVVITGSLLTITSGGFEPAIVSKADLSSLGKPARLDLSMTSRSFGNGRVSWRYPGQTGFPVGQASSFVVTHDNAPHTYQISLSASGPVEAISIQPSSDASDSEISSIVLRNSAGTALTTWSWVDSDGDGTIDNDEINQSRNSNNASDLGFEFERTADMEDWTTLTNIVGAAVSGGSLSGTATTNAPSIVNSGFNYPAAGVPNIAVRLKAGKNGNVQLNFKTIAAPNLIGQYIAVPYTGNGDWQTLVFNLASHPSYSGTATYLRIEPISAATTFAIDWIRASDGDADHDGVPDGEEIAGDADHDGRQNYLDPDSDHDGIPDLQEYITGTSLVTPGPPFSAQVSSDSTANELHLDVDAIPKRLYTLQQNSNLTGSWTDLQQVGPFEAPLKYRFTQPLGATHSFFRITIKLAP